ncbi:hypothetical protein [Sporisorium scitamineum]|nr:hypothetical protein [Sporisorium scitamineum]
MPRMEVRQMIRHRRGQSLARSTRQKLLGWGHIAFLNRLAVKCFDVSVNERYNKARPTVLLVQPEAYTSKTCGTCGELNHSLGSSCRFNCANCCYIADHDYNGAYSMLLKAIKRGSTG